MVKTMARIAILAWLIGGAFAAHAINRSYRNAHPIGWMHLLPVGETPGWSEPRWIDLELNHANVWNNQFSMTDKRTGDVYTYKADFEQSSAIYEFGWALSDSMAFALEVPYANRNGGFLDDFIDQFHVIIGSNRFLRHINDPFGNDFSIQTNGDEHLASQHGQGVGGFKAKLKFWLLKWRSPTPGVCDCGLGFSAQAKFPTQRSSGGLSSGHNDYSGLVHLGVPMFKYVGVWATAGFTKLGANNNIEGWPRREWAQMYELSIDLGLGPNLGLLLQARTESPILMKEYVNYNYTFTNPEDQAQERIASGWNSLVEWRGSQSIGLRWRWGKGNQINLFMVEDWGLGDKDERNDKLYVNNAPDVAFISQWHFVF
ncbi:MAG: DUF3187 family protein [Bdellovibrionales bacterium]